MKKILLKIDDRVYRDLKTALGIRKFSGQDYGIIDSGIFKIISEIEKESLEVELKYKGKSNAS